MQRVINDDDDYSCCAPHSAALNADRRPQPWGEKPERHYYADSIHVHIECRQNQMTHTHTHTHNNARALHQKNGAIKTISFHLAPEPATFTNQVFNYLNTFERCKSRSNALQAKTSANRV